MVLGELFTIWTIRISMLFFASSILARLAGPNCQEVARKLWTSGFLWLLVHVACAFHFFHGWSHQAALADTARRTGEQIGWAFAGGLYFNYVFVALWGFDLLWWWAGPETYFRRSMTVTVGIYGFLLFIAFQATIVFENGPTRWMAAVLFALIGLQFTRHRLRQRQMNSPDSL